MQSMPGAVVPSTGTTAPVAQVRAVEAPAGAGPDASRPADAGGDPRGAEPAGAPLQGDGAVAPELQRPEVARAGLAMPLLLAQLVVGDGLFAGELGSRPTAAGDARPPAEAGHAFYVAPDGQDGNDGTLERPWQTIGAAIARLSAGDTLYLRGGAYLESNIEISDLQGRPDAPITITAYQGERPVLDGAFPEFRSAPNSDWQVHDAGRHVYRSVKTYDLSGTPMVKGKLDAGGTYHALIAYPSLEALTATGEYVSKDPYYMGPGVFWNPSDRRIYVRLQPPSADAVFREFGIPANPDPRRNKLYVWPENVGFAFRGTESAHLVFDGLDYFGLSRVVEIRNPSHHLTFANGTSVNQGFVIARDGAHHLLFDNLELHANIPEYLAWKDLKCGAVGQPGKDTRYAQFAFGDRGAHHVEVRNTTVHRAFDASVITAAGSHDIRFHHNTFHVIDDTMQLGSATYNIEVDHNRIIGAGISHNGGGASAAHPGSKYIHHNIIDQRQDVLWNRKDPQELCDDEQGFVVLKVFPSHNGDGFDRGDPWKIYQNTVIYATTGTGDAGFVQEEENATGVFHEVYNNIIDNRGERWIYRGPRVDDGSQIYDGNAIFRHASSSAPLLVDVRDGEREEDFASLGEFRSSDLFATTRNYYPPGWEANGIEADPRLDAAYAPASSDVLNGGVDLGGKPWPGVEARVYRGAVAPGSDGSGIGDPDAAAARPAAGASFILRPTADTWIREADPTAVNADASRLKVDGNAGGRSLALLRFDLGHVGAGARIRSASLTLETTSPGDGARLHRMLRPWSTGDSWSSLGDGIQADGSEARSAVDLDTGPVAERGPLRLDVAATVQAWIDGEPNHGWAFVPNGKDGWDFRSMDGDRPPILEIVYE